MKREESRGQRGKNSKVEERAGKRQQPEDSATELKVSEIRESRD